MADEEEEQRLNFSEEVEHVPNPSVSDVYQIAQEIGKDFERLIDTFGPESFTPLMPKVVGVLEQLERFASQNDRTEEVLLESKSALDQLSIERKLRAHDRHEYVKDLDALEEKNRLETQKLQNVIAVLQIEKKKLSIQQLNFSPGFECKCVDKVKNDDEENLTADLVKKLTAHLEDANSLVQVKNRELISIRGEVEKLREENEEFHLKFKNIEDRLLKEEREKRNLEQHIHYCKEELSHAQRQLSSIPRFPRRESDCDDNLESLVDQLKDIDLKRNELKAKLSELLDQPLQQPPRKTSRDNNLNLLEEMKETEKSLAVPFSFTGPSQSMRSDEFDAPVQGPLPYESEDVPWRRNDSTGVRNFFRKLFGATETSFGFLK